MKDRKHLYWVVGLVSITIILCGTLVWINSHSWIIRFEMDDNTKEAVESIEFEALQEDLTLSIDPPKMRYVHIQEVCGLPRQVYPDSERHCADNNTEFWDGYYTCKERLLEHYGFESEPSQKTEKETE